MAHRSKLPRIPNITTMVNVFEVRKGPYGIGFSDLKELENVFEVGNGQHAQYRRFNDGNYSVSVLDYSDTKRVVVIHQENVDPSLVVEKTMQPTDEERRAAYYSGKTVFGPFDWFGSRQASSSTGKMHPTIKRRRMDQPGGISGSGDAHSDQSVSRLIGLNLVWRSGGQLDTTDEQMFSDPERMQEIDLSGLLYFIDDCPHDQVQITYSSDGVYKLTLNNIQIGFAVNLAAIIASTVGYTGIVFEDTNSGCFALLVFSSDEIHPLQIMNPSKYALPISSCVYDSIYRSFYNNADKIDNPYYGRNDSADFDFARISDNIFVKILRHLPLAQRVHCRRVSKRWLSMANAALAMDTKYLDTTASFYRYMKSHHFQFFLRLVSDCLEVLILTLGLDLISYATLDTFYTITSFPVLRKFDFGSRSISNIDALLYMLDRMPKLEVLKTAIPRKLPMPNASHGPYAVKKLTVVSDEATDTHLVTFLEHFPNVSRLGIMSGCFYTSSCISWIMEKYASKLCRFKLSGGNNSPPFGAVTGIQACTNLKHLTLYKTNLISDVLMGALAAGCHNLEMLELKESVALTNGGLAALASLRNLTRLDVSSSQWFMRVPQAARDLSEGVTAIAQRGRLTEFRAVYIKLSASCLKAIVRHCRHLKLLDVRDHVALSMDTAIDIVRLYGMWSLESRLVLHSIDKIWEREDVREVIKAIEETNYRQFMVRRDSGGVVIDGDEDVDDSDGWEEDVDDSDGWEEDVDDSDGWDEFGDGSYEWEEDVYYSDG